MSCSSDAACWLSRDLVALPCPPGALSLLEYLILCCLSFSAAFCALYQYSQRADPALRGYNVRVMSQIQQRQGRGRNANCGRAGR